MCSFGAVASVIAKVTTATSPSRRDTRQAVRAGCILNRLSTAVMTMTASVASGRWKNREVMNSRVRATTAEATRDEIPVRAPLPRLMAERENEPETV